MTTLISLDANENPVLHTIRGRKNSTLVLRFTLDLLFSGFPVVVADHKYVFDIMLPDKKEVVHSEAAVIADPVITFTLTHTDNAAFTWDRANWRILLQEDIATPTYQHEIGRGLIYMEKESPT